MQSEINYSTHDPILITTFVEDRGRPLLMERSQNCLSGMLLHRTAPQDPPAGLTKHFLKKKIALNTPVVTARNFENCLYRLTCDVRHVPESKNKFNLKH